MNQQEIIDQLTAILGNQERLNALEQIITEKVIETQNQRIAAAYWNKHYAAIDAAKAEGSDQ